ncbi:hypothetical protein PIB30_020311 [Stylosanthes scabra]|uniref:Uncharacterized protein n=1 Tax=Stylosanthes scabra TaxID=79078 RepID=A0ABU6WAG3_9FABA|nr:hypothetical protein [Stylosanthes scabra]
MAMTSPNSYGNMPSTSYLQREEVVFAGDNPYYYDSISTIQEPIEGEKKKGIGKVDKIVNRIVDKYEKHVPATIRDQINLEELMAKEPNRGPNNATTSRAIDEEPSEQHKIQRFKIRTVVAQDTDKEDHDHTKN